MYCFSNNGYNYFGLDQKINTLSSMVIQKINEDPKIKKGWIKWLKSFKIFFQFSRQNHVFHILLCKWKENLLVCLKKHNNLFYPPEHLWFGNSRWFYFLLFPAQLFSVIKVSFNIICNIFWFPKNDTSHKL